MEQKIFLFHIFMGRNLKKRVFSMKMIAGNDSYAKSSRFSSGKTSNILKEGKRKQKNGRSGKGEAE